jgi:hypothetical protein
MSIPLAPNPTTTTLENRAELEWLALRVYRQRQPAWVRILDSTRVSHQGQSPTNFVCLSCVEPQSEYDTPVAYGAIDRPDDLTKDTIWSECSCRFVCVHVVCVWCACVGLVWVYTWADTTTVSRRETSKKLQYYAERVYQTGTGEDNLQEKEVEDMYFFR